jgi:hypothetical protein
MALAMFLPKQLQRQLKLDQLAHRGQLHLRLQHTSHQLKITHALIPESAQQN